MCLFIEKKYLKIKENRFIDIKNIWGLYEVFK